MTPAQELAAAADKLDALASDASGGPWVVERCEDFLEKQVSWSLPGIERWRGLSNDVQFGEDEATARYVAAMNPLVGQALAEMLRRFEYACESDSHRIYEMWRSPELQRVESRIPGLLAALDLARLINGTGSKD